MMPARYLCATPPRYAAMREKKDLQRVTLLPGLAADGRIPSSHLLALAGHFLQAGPIEHSDKKCMLAKRVGVHTSPIVEDRIMAWHICQ